MSKKKPEIESRTRASDIDVWCSHDELVDITELVQNPRNPNTHPDKQIALLAKIIKNQGWRQPITVSKRSGFIVKGHGRLAASKVLMVENVPVDYQDYATEAEEYADLIADNRIAELAEIDEDMISDLLGDTMFDDFDMDLTGFDSVELGVFDVDEIDPPELNDGDREPFRQMTFTVHDSQFEEIEFALKKAKDEGGGDSDVNENGNGNALAFLCERFNNGQS
jgi:hypothetical protein